MTQIPKTQKEEKQRRELIFGAVSGGASMAKAEKVSNAIKELDRGFAEEQIARQAKKSGVPYFNLTTFPIDNAAVTLITEDQAKGAEVIPFYRDGQHIKVGMLNPGNSQLHELVEFLKKSNFQIDLYIISKASFEAGLKRYGSIRPPNREQERVVISELQGLKVDKLKELETMQESITTVSPTELISSLLTSAVIARASDIHLQPEEKYLAVRLRIDGVLQEAAKFHSSVYHNLISRIKILSKLKINVTKVPQDGSFVIDAGNRTFEIRVSLLPSAYGESIVLRILGEQTALNVQDIGMRALAYERILIEIQKPNGLILTAGPTGSGKTTTLYSFLKTVNKPGVKTITLEDPIEYRLEGVEQIQIDQKAGLTFANALKSTLRQDPDVLMVGEIRDLDTAEAAAQAALTGHLVFSTLHTNDAAGAIPRFLNLGVQPVVLAPALTTVIAQRLVRRICQDCKEVQELDPALLKRVNRVLEAIPSNSKEQVPSERKFYHSRGCKACHHVGYKGRMGVFEVFIMDDAMQQLVFKGASTVEIKALAIKSGMVTMIQDGLLKALEGITDVAEVFRVTEGSKNSL